MSTDKFTEADVLARLMLRYNKQLKNGNWRGPKYVRAQHVPNGLSWRVHRRIADFIAMDTQTHSSGEWATGREYVHAPVFHGHEVKVSRSDWLTELRDPTKADAFKPYMHFWWLVVSDKNFVKDDLPDDWGLMVTSGKSTRILKPAPRLTPEPMPADLYGALLRAAVRTERNAHE